MGTFADSPVLPPLASGDGAPVASDVPPQLSRTASLAALPFPDELRAFLATDPLAIFVGFGSMVTQSFEELVKLLLFAAGKTKNNIYLTVVAFKDITRFFLPAPTYARPFFTSLFSPFNILCFSSSYTHQSCCTACIRTTALANVRIIVQAGWSSMEQTKVGIGSRNNWHFLLGFFLFIMINISLPYFTLPYVRFLLYEVS